MGSSLLGVGRAADGAPDPTPPKRGAELLKTDILGVFAHPDDETGMAATVARYALGEGKTVAHVYCTRGEGGGNMVGTQGGAALGILREAELRAALRTMGVRYCYFLDQLDWAYTESVAATLNKWDSQEALRRLVRLVRTLRPEIIVTMNPAPTPGQHGHHQAAGRLATEAFLAAGDATKFPEQFGVDGLEPWRPRKLYYGGSSGEFLASVVVTNNLPDGRTPADVAASALSNHRSQGFGGFGNAAWLRRPQSFTLVKSLVAMVPLEDGLFGGLPISPMGGSHLVELKADSYEVSPGVPFTVTCRVLGVADGSAGPSVSLELPAGWTVLSETPSQLWRVVPPASALGMHQTIWATVNFGTEQERKAVIVEGRPVLRLDWIPRPAIASYRDWTRRMETQPVAGRLTDDMPVVAGEETVVRATARNAGMQPLAGALVAKVPEGWTVAPARLDYQLASGQSRVLEFRLRVPEDATSDGTISISGSAGGSELSATAKAHPVPRMSVPRTAMPLPLSGGDGLWIALPEHKIGTNQVWEGKVSSEADSSARFWLAHDAQGLYLQVDVKDDQVVSNIAPNDIKGHWRSDSIEICLDPDAGAENTFRCFKVGIFPFDTTGAVRGARDADALPGPIEQTAPGLRLSSQRLADGYRIRAVIAWSDLHLQPKAGQRLGFNLLIYDGDKVGAAVGENINKSRLAWSPRSGVMGRPEDWGRITLE